MSSGHRDRRTFSPGRVIQGYEIIDLVGQGGFGDIYAVRRRGEDALLAMKVEYRSSRKQALSREHGVLSALGGCAYFPRFVAYAETKRLRFIVMELMGPSVTDVRKALDSGRYSLSSALRLGIETLRALRALHARGFLHRDFKPSQVLIRASRAHPIALIDFGLSRRYVDAETGEYVTPRARPGFVGTGKYASLNAHRDKELGRRDDLFSWFYSLVELCVGRLPWPSVRDREQIHSAKARADMVQYCEENGLPRQLRAVYRMIESYGRCDEPNYDLIIAYLAKAMEEAQCSWDDPYEWEKLPKKVLKTISAISLTPPEGERPIVPDEGVALPEEGEAQVQEEKAKKGLANCKIF